METFQIGIFVSYFSNLKGQQEKSIYYRLACMGDARKGYSLGQKADQCLRGWGGRRGLAVKGSGKLAAVRIF